MRTKLKVSITLIAVIAASLTTTPSSQATTKTGAKCAKKGIVSNSAGKSFTCVKIGKFLIWGPGYSINKPVPTNSPAPVVTPTPKPTPVATLGSIGAPVPAGSPLKIGDLTYTINTVTFNIDPILCAANSFNTGCKTDDNLAGIVDPASTATWVAVSFNVQNAGTGIASPAGFSTQFDLVLPSGQLLENQDFVFGYPSLLSDVRIIPGGSGTGSVLFQVPKSVTSLKSFLVIRDQGESFTPTDYYFQISW
jgi:hypothetical protein